MILVRQVFQTQIGKAKDVATMIMQNTAIFSQTAGPIVHGRVLTDLSGPFGTVVLEIELESLAEWERVQAVMSAKREGQEGSSGESTTIYWWVSGVLYTRRYILKAAHMLVVMVCPHADTPCVTRRASMWAAVLLCRVVSPALP